MDILYQKNKKARLTLKSGAQIGKGCSEVDEVRNEGEVGWGRGLLGCLGELRAKLKVQMKPTPFTSIIVIHAVKSSTLIVYIKIGKLQAEKDSKGSAVESGDPQRGVLDTSSGDALQTNQPTAP